MKLIIGIIENDYVNDVIEGLMEENIRATKLASTGGFLKSGNTTLLIGADEGEKDKVINIIKNSTDNKKVSSKKGNVEVGANLFIINMDDYLRI